MVTGTWPSRRSTSTRRNRCAWPTSAARLVASTPMEVGSLTKAMTGLVVADSIRRGELRLDAPVSTYLPQLHGAAAGDVTMGELVTHRAGYAEFGAATLRRAAWSAPVGRNWITTSLDPVSYTHLRAHETRHDL